MTAEWYEVEVRAVVGGPWEPMLINGEWMRFGSAVAAEGGGAVYMVMNKIATYRVIRVSGGTRTPVVPKTPTMPWPTVHYEAEVRFAGQLDWTPLRRNFSDKGKRMTWKFFDGAERFVRMAQAKYPRLIGASTRIVCVTSDGDREVVR